MIAKIEPPMSAFYDVIKYHENKVSSGVASVLHSDLPGDSISSKAHELANITDLKPGKKNLCKHISLNFPPGEILSDEKLSSIAFEYKNRLGYENTPCLLYKHQDKGHLHVHLVMPTVDYDGNNIRDSFEHDRSFAISRHLEKEFGLRPLEQNLAPKQNYTFNELFSKQHSFQSAFKRCWADSKAKPFLLEFLTKEEQDKLWNKKPFSNSAVLSLIGKDRFTTLMSYFDHKGYTSKYNKDFVLSILDNTLSKSDSKGEFFSRLSSSAIDTSLVSKYGSNHYIYSCPSLLFSIKDTRLPKTYSYDSLSGSLHFDPNGFILPSEQKHILYNSLNLSLQQSNSFVGFLSDLRTCGIHLEPSQDSFRVSLPCSNPVSFELGEIHKKFSLDNLSTRFLSLEDKSSVPSLSQPVLDSIYQHQQSSYPHYVPDSFVPSPGGISTPVPSRHVDDPENLRQKPKKKQKQKPMSNDLTL